MKTLTKFFALFASIILCASAWAQQPDWSSTPDSATGLDFGSHSTSTGVYPLDLVVTNAGAAGSTLTGSCDVAGSAVFSIPGDGTLGAGLAMGASANITVACDTTSAAVQLHTGTMSCTHDGDGTTETSITDYALSCNVTATPQPDWSSTPDSATGLDFGSHSTSTGVYPLDLVVTNAGAAGSTLTGSCDVAGSAVFSIPGDGTLGAGLAMGASANITVACDTTSAAVQLHTGTMSCTHDGDGTTETSITDYALSCNVTATPQPDWSSTPDSATGLDFGSHSTSTGVYPLDLVVTNAGAAGSTLTGSCDVAGSAVFSIPGDGTLGAGLAMGASANITVACDTTSAAVQLHTGTMSCTHDGDGTTETSITDYALSCNVTATPQPDWSSTPDSATGLDFGSHSTSTGVYPLDLVVTNAGAAGSTLTGSCDVAGSAVFSIPGDGTLGAGLAMGASANITVACDTTSAAVQLHTGTMSCTHDGDGTTETSITDYALSCNVTATPEPSFLGVDSGLSTMGVPEQGDPDATATLTVSNNGNSGTTLIGSCVYAGNTEIAVTNGTFAVAQGDPGVDVLATCSGATEGTYTGTLTCGPTVPQTWVAANSPYAVSCTVGPPGDAVYKSIPTLSAWGLSLMILTLLGLGGIIIRRRAII